MIHFCSIHTDLFNFMESQQHRHTQNTATRKRLRTSATPSSLARNQHLRTCNCLNIIPTGPAFNLKYLTYLEVLLKFMWGSWCGCGDKSFVTDLMTCNAEVHLIPLQLVIFCSWLMRVKWQIRRNEWRRISGWMWSRVIRCRPILYHFLMALICGAGPIRLP